MEGEKVLLKMLMDRKTTKVVLINLKKPLTLQHKTYYAVYNIIRSRLLILSDYLLLRSTHKQKHTQKIIKNIH